MHDFAYQKPSTLGELCDLAATHGSAARLLAGGTDLIVAMRTGSQRPKVVIDAKHVEELGRLSVDREGLTVGAAVSCRRLWTERATTGDYPALIDSASLIGGTAVQGRASIGGNLCNAAPSADSVPTLIALGAVAHIAGPDGTRRLPVEKFCLAPGKNALALGEVLVHLHIPAPAERGGAAFKRFIPRNEMDIAVVNAAARVELDESGTRFLDARVAVGSVAPTPLFVGEAGDAMKGQAVSRETIANACEIATSHARPISDMRGSAEQRTLLTRVMTRRAIDEAVARAGGTVSDG